MRVAAWLVMLSACGGGPQAAHTVVVAPAPSAATATADSSATSPVPPSTPSSPQAHNRPTRLPGSSIRFTGGDGSSKAAAIKIEGAHGESDGTASEYRYLEMVYGPPDSAWTMEQQSLLNDAGRSYDALRIVLVDGSKLTVFFDISDYFGKM